MSFRPPNGCRRRCSLQQIQRQRHHHTMSVFRQIFPRGPHEETAPDTLHMRFCHRHALCSAFSPTGLYLAFGCRGGFVVVWDFLARSLALDGCVIPPPPPPPAESNGCAATAGAAAGGRCDDVTNIAWDSSGKWLYAATSSSTQSTKPEVYILDLEQGRTSCMSWGQVAMEARLSVCLLYTSPSPRDRG